MYRIIKLIKTPTGIIEWNSLTFPGLDAKLVCLKLPETDYARRRLDSASDCRKGYFKSAEGV